jgi:putative heme-binding domain-containing protein
MNQRTQFVLAAMCALFCGLSIPNGAFGQALPDGKGKAEFVRICTACHGTDRITNLRKTPDEWRKTVDDMVDRGAEGSKEDLDNVALYLATNFEPDKSGSTAASQSTMNSSASGGPAALNSAEIERVKRLIADNGCLTCHRIEEQGAYTGPTLNGLEDRRTAEEIRAAIVSPHPKLDPSNDLIRLTTADGKTLIGRILGQDDQSVRAIDASGEIATYSKSGPRQFTIVDTNPMPSFENKITGVDLDNLVRYLDSLPSVEESDHQ